MKNVMSTDGLNRLRKSLPKAKPEPSKGALFMKNRVNADSPVKLVMPVDKPELRLPVDLVRRVRWAWGVLTGRYHAIEFTCQGERLVHTHSDRLDMRLPTAPQTHYKSDRSNMVLTSGSKDAIKFEPGARRHIVKKLPGLN